MEHPIKNPETEIDPADEKNIQEIGSNLTGTARPAWPDEKEYISHHLNKNTQHSKIQNTDALLGNINPENINPKES